MTRDVEDVDRLLRQAGSRWRVGQPPAPDIGSLDFTPRRRRFQWLEAIRAVAAFTLAFGALGAIVTLRETGPGVSGSGSVVRDGDAVIAAGTILKRPGSTTVICRPFGRLDVGSDVFSPPTCSPLSVPLRGFDIGELPGSEEREGVTFAPLAVVRGRWTGEAIEVEEVSAAPEPAERAALACPRPEGGWPPGPRSAVEGEAAVRRVASEIARNPAVFGGYWSVLGPSAIREDEANVLVVAVKGDLDEARARVSEVYPYGICLVPVAYGIGDLEEAAAAIADVPGLVWDPQVDHELNRVRVRITMVDDTWGEVLAAHPQVVAEPLVRRAED